MSYEKVKQITITKDNKIFITSACNNLIPLDYSRWEYKGDIYSLLLDINSGELQPTLSTSKGKYEYYNLRVREWLKEYEEKNKDTIPRHKVYGIYWWDVKQNLKVDIEFKTFVDNLLKEKVPKDNYKLKYEDNYLIGLTKFGFKYSKYGKAKEFNYYTSKVIKDNLSKYNLISEVC